MHVASNVALIVWSQNILTVFREDRLLHTHVFLDFDITESHKSCAPHWFNLHKPPRLAKVTRIAFRVPASSHTLLGAPINIWMLWPLVAVLALLEVLTAAPLA